ncbi:hypothetical protein CONLIGDRAFT_39724 [Coniochaeta ligniaria NRRL 30616]|uniref:Uncharacterized protein n=1 Tax=Coniochaeta ligniaria NRRL 30616 TaxID=1408157 RepID=A0A1J7J6Q0_9PEZI|nr:hypothetical protein CONLIGDRAFT_39724 [Coniochaeta ligniaria NRRL 30616]
MEHVGWKGRVNEGLIEALFECLREDFPEGPVTCGQSGVGLNSSCSMYLSGYSCVAAKQQEQLISAQVPLRHRLALKVLCLGPKRPGAPKTLAVASLFRKWEKTSTLAGSFPSLLTHSNLIDCFQNNPHPKNNNTTSGPVPTTLHHRRNPHFNL